nr:glycosidase [Hyphomonas sp.]
MPLSVANCATTFTERRSALIDSHSALLSKPNTPKGLSNGVFQRWQNPVVTAAHVPLEWRYDFDPARNPFLMERLGVNATFNAGAIYHKGKHCLAVRVEGADRKSFFAIAESESGIDHFEFRKYPIRLPQSDDPETNAYDMRLVAHEDGWIYGLYCAERKDLSQPHDVSAADAQCGIVRTRNLIDWERLPDLKTKGGQQRNVVLHPEFIDGKYGLYTRPQDGFINVGTGGGIGWALTEDMSRAEIDDQVVVDPKVYHTNHELKNGQGPAPLKTDHGWLHLAHGVRGTAAGLRYVLYMFMTDLAEPWKVIHRPSGYFMAPESEERTGDVSNVLFCNGWTLDIDGQVFIYYASSDTRMHVATTTLAQLIDYNLNSPEDGLTSAASVEERYKLIDRNARL